MTTITHSRRHLKDGFLLLVVAQPSCRLQNGPPISSAQKKRPRQRASSPVTIRSRTCTPGIHAEAWLHFGACILPTPKYFPVCLAGCSLRVSEDNSQS